MNQYDPYNQNPEGQPYPNPQPPQTPSSYQAVYGAPGVQTGGAHAAPTQTSSVYASAQPTSTQNNPQNTPPGANANMGGAQAKKSGSSGAKTFLIAFAGALVACLLSFGVMSAVNGLTSGTNRPNVSLGADNPNAITSVEGVDGENTLAESVANACLPSVVSINVFSTQSTGSGNSLYDFFYGYGLNGNSSDEGALVQSGVGSGVVLSDDGYIITNNHVVAGGSVFEVIISGETYTAELIGTDESSDVAVLKVDGSGFTPIAIGDSDNIRIGEWVMSIGSPFGLEQSVATGIISATSRSQIIDSSSNLYGGSTPSSPILYPNLIQTDAAINPGNSGGALVDAEGKLIGINTLITSYSGNYSGVGFAIPVNYAINIAQDLIAGNEPTHAQLGVSLTTVNNQTASRYALSATSGALISSVVEGGPAAQAGIKTGDIVTEFDGKKITSASDLMLQVRTKQPGDVVALKIDRDGQDQDINVTLGESASQSSNSNQNPLRQNRQNSAQIG